MDIAEPIAAADFVVEVLLGPGLKNDAQPTEEVVIVLDIDCLPIGRNGDLRRAGDDHVNDLEGQIAIKNSRDTHPQNLQKVVAGAFAGF